MKNYRVKRFQKASENAAFFQKGGTEKLPLCFVHKKCAGIFHQIAMHLHKKWKLWGGKPFQ